MGEESTTVTGSCLCEAVKYTIAGTPKRILICHCINCRKACGSAFAHNYAFRPGSITFQQGEERVRKYDDTKTTSGNTLFRHFCEVCASPIYLTNSAFGGLVVAHMGNVNQLADETPVIELYEEYRRPWMGCMVEEKK